MIKIDVEGFEIDVMEGLSSFLAVSRPVLWVEISAEAPGRRIDMPRLKSYLSGDYRFYLAQAVSPLLTVQKFVETETVPVGSAVDIIAISVRS